MKAAFIFSGQGAQAVGMGRDLANLSTAAAQIFQAADRALDWSVSDVCFNGPADKLTQSEFCQPSIYTASAACLAAFHERFPSVRPVAAAGLSLGEYCALYCAGFFSFEDGLKLLQQRANFMAQACAANPGGMTSILGGDPDTIRDVCAQYDIDVANFNCPGQIVISGPLLPLEKAAADLKAKGAKRVIPLKVAGSFHSRLMRSAGEKLAAVIDNVPVAPLQLPVAQNFIGGFPDSESSIKENLVRQVAGSVRWDDCVRQIVEKTGADTFIEFGPGSVLSGLVRKIDPSRTVMNVSSAADLDKTSF